MLTDRQQVMRERLLFDGPFVQQDINGQPPCAKKIQIVTDKPTDWSWEIRAVRGLSDKPQNILQIFLFQVLVLV